MTQQLQGKPQGTPLEPAVYSYMEFITASSMSPWHIRKLTGIGQKFSGGIDTSPLCGRKWDDGSVINGWDLKVPISSSHDDITCRKCLKEYESILGGAHD